MKQRKHRFTPDLHVTLLIAWFQFSFFFAGPSMLWAAGEYGVVSRHKAGGAPGTQGLVLLRNGSVIEGTIRRVNGGYAIRVSHGEIAVAESQIDAVCSTINEAYQHRRNRLPVGDTKAHLELALWCLRYQLVDEAKAEIEAAAALSPQHPMLPLLRRRLELLIEQSGREEQLPAPESGEYFDQQATATVAHAGSQVQEKAFFDDGAGVRPASLVIHPAARNVAVESVYRVEPRTTSELELTTLPPLTDPSSQRGGAPSVPGTWAAPPARPLPRQHGEPMTTSGADKTRFRQQQLDQVLRGLPPGTVQQFTNTVQPIITHYCGTSRCHGGPQPEGFRWLRPPGAMPPTRQTTQENLLAILRFIDWDQPGASPLLRVPLQPHGGLPTPVFSSANSPQYQALVRWVWSVAAGTSAQALGEPVGPTPPGDVSYSQPEKMSTIISQQADLSPSPSGSLASGSPALSGIDSRNLQSSVFSGGPASSGQEWLGGELPAGGGHGLSGADVWEGEGSTSSQNRVREVRQPLSFGEVHNHLLSAPHGEDRGSQGSGLDFSHGRLGAISVDSDSHEVYLDGRKTLPPAVTSFRGEAGEQVQESAPHPAAHGPAARLGPVGSEPLGKALPGNSLGGDNRTVGSSAGVEDPSREKASRWFLPWKLRLSEIFR